MTDPEMQDRLADTSGEAEAQMADGAKPALTIHIHSWATPVVGLVMLLIGLVAGFYAYPLVEDRLGSGQVVAADLPTSAAAPGAGALQPTDAAAAAESQAKLMEFVVSQTNQFIGDPNAPVTLIEFSDFQ